MDREESLRRQFFGSPPHQWKSKASTSSTKKVSAMNHGDEKRQKNGGRRIEGCDSVGKLITVSSK
jgi:hypothetical protein